MIETSRSSPFLVDATGAMRRLRALGVVGYSQAHLADLLGLPPQSLSLIITGQQGRIDELLHAAIRTLYSAHWAEPVPGAAGDRARALARANAWHGPLAWDDFDDPAELPNLDGAEPDVGGIEPDPADAPKKAPPVVDEIAVEKALAGEHVTLTRPERLIAVGILHAKRWNDQRIARTLHVADRTVLRDRRALKLTAWKSHEQEQDDYA